MKRLLSAALALSLLGTTAAQADPFDHRQHEHYDIGRGHDRDYGWDRGRDHFRRDNHDAGAALAVGVGLIALTAILASNHDRERDYDRYDAPPPPPPPEYGPGPRGPYGPGPYDR